MVQLSPPGAIFVAEVQPGLPTETRKVEQAKAPTESGQSGTDGLKEATDGLQNKYVERIYYADPDKVDTITIDVSVRALGRRPE
jgi:hypothetical protein